MGKSKSLLSELRSNSLGFAPVYAQEASERVFKHDPSRWWIMAFLFVAGAEVACGFMMELPPMLFPLVLLVAVGCGGFGMFLFQKNSELRERMLVETKYALSDWFRMYHPEFPVNEGLFSFWALDIIEGKERTYYSYTAQDGSVWYFQKNSKGLYFFSA